MTKKLLKEFAETAALVVSNYDSCLDESYNGRGQAVARSWLAASMKKLGRMVEKARKDGLL